MGASWIHSAYLVGATPPTFDADYIKLLTDTQQVPGLEYKIGDCYFRGERNLHGVWILLLYCRDERLHYSWADSMKLGCGQISALYWMSLCVRLRLLLHHYCMYLCFHLCQILRQLLLLADFVFVYQYQSVAVAVVSVSLLYCDDLLYYTLLVPA